MGRGATAPAPTSQARKEAWLALGRRDGATLGKLQATLLQGRTCPQGKEDLLQSCVPGTHPSKPGTDRCHCPPEHVPPPWMDPAPAPSAPGSTCESPPTTGQASRGPCCHAAIQACPTGPAHKQLVARKASPGPRRCHG